MVPPESRPDERTEAPERQDPTEVRAADEAALHFIRLMIGLAVSLGAIAVVVFFVVTGTSADTADTKPAGRKASLSDFPQGFRIPAPPVDLKAAARAANCRLSDPPPEGNKHVTFRVRYRSNPPTSGNHDRTPASAAAYVEAPPPEQTVHALEHGRIFIQFRPDAGERTRGQLFALFHEDRYHMLLAPNNTGMRWEVAATAWNHALLCPKLNNEVFDAIRAFRDRYRDRGPELVG